LGVVAIDRYVGDVPKKARAAFRQRGLVSRSLRAEQREAGVAFLKSAGAELNQCL